MGSRVAGVGVGMRPELAADLVASPALVDFVEVVAETCYTQRATRREVHALAEIWPVVPHGVKLSLGSAEGVDLDRARRLGELARALRAPMISEHVAFTRAGGHEIGHLTQLPRTREAVAAVVRNAERVRRVLPDVPLVLENVAWSVLWPGDDELDEASFYEEIVAATGCDLLLDVSNLYANALNEGRDPRDVLAGYPLDRVAMVHVAGGITEHGFYYDTHAHPVPDAVFDLVARVVAARRVPVMIERDANFAFAELVGELSRLRALVRDPQASSPVRVPAPLARSAPMVLRLGRSRLRTGRSRSPRPWSPPRPSTIRQWPPSVARASRAREISCTASASTTRSRCWAGCRARRRARAISPRPCSRATTGRFSRPG